MLDNAVAGHSGTVRIVVHRPPHGSGRPWCPKHPGDLAVRRHPSTGDPGHKGIDPGEKARRLSLRLESSPPVSCPSR